MVRLSDYAWVDEFLQIDVGILCQPNKLTYSKARRGTPIEETAFQQSALLRRMCQGKRR